MSKRSSGWMREKWCPCQSPGHVSSSFKQGMCSISLTYEGINPEAFRSDGVLNDTVSLLRVSARVSVLPWLWCVRLHLHWIQGCLKIQFSRYQVDDVEILTEDTECLCKAELDVSSLFFFGCKLWRRWEGSLFIDHCCRCSSVVGGGVWRGLESRHTSCRLQWVLIFLVSKLMFIYHAKPGSHVKMITMEWHWKIHKYPLLRRLVSSNEESWTNFAAGLKFEVRHWSTIPFPATFRTSNFST